MRLRPAIRVLLGYTDGRIEERVVRSAHALRKLLRSREISSVLDTKTGELLTL